MYTNLIRRGNPAGACPLLVLPETETETETETRWGQRHRPRKRDERKLKTEQFPDHPNP